MSREKEAGTGQILKGRTFLIPYSHPVPVSSKLKVWKLRRAIEEVKHLEDDLELAKASDQTYLLCAEIKAEFERLKQPFRDAMRRLK